MIRPEAPRRDGCVRRPNLSPFALNVLLLRVPPSPPSSHRIASSRSRSGSPSSGRNPPAPRQAYCECTEPGGSPLSGPGAAAAGSLLRSPSPEGPLSPRWPSAAAAHGARLGQGLQLQAVTTATGSDAHQSLLPLCAVEG